jgi:hypothetical protein
MLPAHYTALALRMTAEDHAARLPERIAHVVRPFAHVRPDNYPGDLQALRLALRYWLDRPSARLTASERETMREALTLLSDDSVAEEYARLLAPLLYRRSERVIADEVERERRAREYDTARSSR